MASLNEPINTTGIDTTTQFDLIPEGWYQCIVSESDELQNGKGTGRMIMLEFTIGSGKYSGKTVRTWLNYQHPSAKAQEIALKQLAKLMECTRVPSPLKDTAQLHAKSLDVLIGIDGTYNKVVDYRVRAITQGDLHKPAEAQKGFADLEEPDWARDQ